MKQKAHKTLPHFPKRTLFSPKILHNLCFSFLLGITAVPREIENNAYANFFFFFFFWGGGGEGGRANKVNYGKCEGCIQQSSYYRLYSLLQS